MIDIRLEVLGNSARASCTIHGEGGREETFSKIEPTGAKALTAIVEALSNRHAGESWRIASDPTLSGVVPAKAYRKPYTPKKKRPQQIRWC